VQIPREPRETPPSVFADSGSYHITWTPIRDPYLELGMSLHVGASVDTKAKVSPWVGLGLVRAFGMADFGPSVDLSGAGVFGGVEVLPSLTINASYRILRVNSDGASLALSLAYRF
jgi:hypothetical protein